MMIKIVPELPQDNTNLAKKLPLIDRYHAIMDGVDTTISELNQFQNKEYAIGIEFSIYGKVHKSLISDYMSAVTDAVDGEPSLVLMIRKGTYNSQSESFDFEKVSDPNRLDQYNEIVRWMLEKRGVDVNLHVGMNPAPNPYALFAHDAVCFVSPFPDGYIYKIANPQYLDIFAAVNLMILHSGENDNTSLEEIVHVGTYDGDPKYTFKLTNGATGSNSADESDSQSQNQ